MKLETKNFGSIEFDEKQTINFPEGLPAFEKNKDYILIAEPETDFCYLQSIEDSNLTFVLIDLKTLKPDYDPMVVEEQLSCIGEIKENLSIYNICVIKDTIKNMTVNLMAPIVINNDSNKGKQVILENKDYKVKHNLIYS
ncbi:MAG: flagellar assembly protein FliW [Lachnospirales bacterium]